MQAGSRLSVRGENQAKKIIKERNQDRETKEGEENEGNGQSPRSAGIRHFRKKRENLG